MVIDFHQLLVPATQGNPVDSVATPGQYSSQPRYRRASSIPSRLE
jgi:hypothetical protein